MAETYVRAGQINWAATGSDVRVQERTLAPGQEIPWHYHTIISDKTYCITGNVRIEMLSPAEQIVLAPGESHVVPINRPHRITPHGESPCRFLLVQGVGKYDRHPIDPKTWQG
jgi:quercetin dioxygenase-like cupin family protein